MNDLIISNQYPAEKFNLLGNTSVMAKVPDIKSPVVQVVQLNPDPAVGDVYLYEKAYNNNPNKYAITKNGLKKLADGAGIKMISSEHVIPSTCQKCVAVNQHSGKVVQCGACSNQDVAYGVTISVPQLTGEVLTVEDTHEIIVNNVVVGMSEKQKSQFMRNLPQICEAKALNGAIRTALHIKGTYTLEEISKPFVVAYLVPNLDNADVKKAALSNMFQSSNNLFGTAPSIQQIESRVPDVGLIESSDGENYDEFIDDTYKVRQEQQTVENPKLAQEQQIVYEQPQRQETRGGSNGDLILEDLYCEQCGSHVSERVYEYSINKFGKPLCVKCQRGAGK